MTKSGPLGLLYRAHLALTSRYATLASIIFLALLMLYATVGAPQAYTLTGAELARLQDERPLWFVISEPLGLLDVYRSRLFYVSIGFLVYNLCGNLLSRAIGLPATLRPGAAPSNAAMLSRLPLYATLATSHDAPMTTVAQAIRRAGYFVQVAADGRGLAAVRGRYAAVASLLFHGCIIFLVIGGALSVSTTFSGAVALGISETFDGTAEGYAGGAPRVLGDGQLPDVQFTLESLEVDYVDDVVIDARAQVRDRHGSTHLVRVNEPFIEDGASVRLVDYGLAPAFQISGPFPGGRAGVVAKLNVMPAGTVDEIELPQTGVPFHVALYPNYRDQGGEPASDGRALLNPVAHVSYDRGGEVTGELVPLGESARVGAYTVAMPEIGYWGTFVIDRDRGKAWVYLGFILGFIALCWRFLWPRSWVYALVEPSSHGALVHLATRHEYTRTGSARRFQRIVSDLRAKHRVARTPETGPEPGPRGRAERAAEVAVDREV